MKNIIRYCGLLLVGLVSCMEDEAPSVELNVALDKQVYQAVSYTHLFNFRALFSLFHIK